MLHLKKLARIQLQSEGVNVALLVAMVLGGRVGGVLGVGGGGKHYSAASCRTPCLKFRAADIFSTAFQTLSVTSRQTVGSHGGFHPGSGDARV